MKKHLLTVLIAMMMVPLFVKAQDTIVGWTFNQDADTSLYANFGITSNLGVRYIAAEDTGGVQRTITFTTGNADYAATSTEWDNGDSVKYWSIKFKAQGYENLALCSKQRSGGATPGPKYFKVQYKLSGGEFADIPGTDTIVVGNDWTSGVLSNIALPAECNDTSVSIYIRWLMITNTSSTGTTVASTGISKIDEIFILGTPVPFSVPETENEVSVSIYPNPASGFVTIEGKQSGRITVMDLLGNKIIDTRKENENLHIDLNGVNAGVYFIRMQLEGMDRVVTRKLIIQ
jgi:hypothetical protein